jgi:transcription antitermination factor NusG
MVAGVAHCPEVGVNVYVVVAVLFTAGDQLPVIAGAFEDEAGNEIVPPEQIGAI